MSHLNYLRNVCAQPFPIIKLKYTSTNEIEKLWNLWKWKILMDMMDINKNSKIKFVV